MSGRGSSADLLTALGASNYRPVLLVELQFDAGTVYCCNLDTDVSWNSHTWLGLGKLGGITTAEEGENIQAYGLALTLSGITPAHIAIALGEQYQGRKVKVYFGVFNDSYQLVSSPIVVFRGRMDNMEITQGETFTVQVNCEGRLADFERPRVRRYNHEDQIGVYPDDRGLEFVPQMVEKTLNWGVPT